MRRPTARERPSVKCVWNQCFCAASVSSRNFGSPATNVANASTPGYEPGAHHSHRRRAPIEWQHQHRQRCRRVRDQPLLQPGSRQSAEYLTEHARPTDGAAKLLHGKSTICSVTTIGGLSTSLQSFYSAFSDVANCADLDCLAPSAARQGAERGGQLPGRKLRTHTSLNADVNSRITADVTQINSIATAISALNKQIVVGTAQDGGQAPNELIDQRDQLVSNLSQLVGVQHHDGQQRCPERVRGQRAASGAAGPEPRH